METKVDVPTKIKPRKEYNSTEIERAKLIPWAKSSRKITQFIKEDLAGKNLLQATILGSGTNTRYTVKGRNLIKYVNNYWSLK